jgi:hypothetical protein
MAHEVTIKWPKKDGSTQLESSLLVASGRAKPTIIGVSGVLERTDAPGSIPGVTVAFYLVHRDQNVQTKREDSFYRWMILFKQIGSGASYTLTVTGRDATGRAYTDTCDFSTAVRAVDVQWPSDNEDITDEKDDFTPYGDLTDYPLGAVKMYDSQSHQILPVYTFGDYTDLDFWTAQFPSLGPGTYTLHVEDSSGVGSAVNVQHLVVT